LAKKPTIRPSYTGDSQYLLRLALAIERDTTRSVEWRQETVAIVRYLVSRFSNYVEENTRRRETEETQETGTSETGSQETPTKEASQKDCFSEAKTTKAQSPTTEAQSETSEAQTTAEEETAEEKAC